MIIDLSSTFESSSHISFNVIDQTINNNSDFDSVESKQSKNIYEKLISDVSSIKAKINLCNKKMFFNTKIFIQVDMYKNYTHRSTDQLILNRFKLSFASLNLVDNNTY